MKISLGMSARFRLSFCGLALVAGPAFGQTPAPVVSIAPVVVEERLLTADAGGLTRMHLDAATPAASQTLAAATPRLAGLTLQDSGAGSFGSLLALRGLANTPYFSDPAVSLAFEDIPLGSTFPPHHAGWGDRTVPAAWRSRLQPRRKG
jgi:hypothetical protein